MFRTVFLFSLVISLAAAGAWAQEAAGQQLFIYANIPGISEGASNKESLGHLANEAHKDEIAVLGYTDWISSTVSFDGEYTTIGLPNFHPVTFLKHFDKTTPLLESYVRNRALGTITFSFYLLNPDSGDMELILTKKFEDCYLAGVEKVVLNQAERAHLVLPMMEKVSFVFKRMTTTHEKTGVQFTTDIERPY